MAVPIAFVKLKRSKMVPVLGKVMNFLIFKIRQVWKVRLMNWMGAVTNMLRIIDPVLT